MAASGYTPIQLYHSTTASAVPVNTDLVNGELAINIADGKLYYKDSGGTVQVIATKGTGTIGGSNTQVQYNSSGVLAGSANFTFNGTTATINTLNLTNALGATYGGTAQSTYTQGDLLYASAANTLSKLAIGSNTYILTSNGTVPGWAAPSSISVNTATNLAGGAGGSVPYQSGAGATTFLSIGTANQVMTSSGSLPQWSSGLSITTLTASDAVTFSATTQNIALGTSQTTGTFTVGGAAQTGTQTFDQSTKTHTLNLGTGATESGLTKTINLGTGGVSTSTTAINIGSANGTTTTLNGTVTAATLNSTTIDTTNLEVTNIKAKDGTAALSIADSTGVITVTKDAVVNGLTLGKGLGSVLTNTALGRSALAANTVGDLNTAVGNLSLTSNIGGTGNTAVGHVAMTSHQGGSLNTAVGAGSLTANLNGNNNTAIGQSALGTATGSNNTAVGSGAGSLITNGNKNTIIGNYDGNQGGLDIRTADNYIVLSDGDGNPRAHWDGSGNTFLKGSYVSFGNNGYIRIDQTNSMAIQAGSSSTVGWQVRNNGNSSAMLSMSGTSQNTLALEGASPQAGTGITFPATQSASTDANTLDDYEEGDWTPSYTGTSGDPTVSYTTRTAKYVKIGKQVTAWCYVYISTTTGGGGNIYLSGLPFTCTGVQGGAFNNWSNNGWTTQAPQSGHIPTGQTYVMLTYYIATGTAQVPVANLANACELTLCMTYQTN